MSKVTNIIVVETSSVLYEGLVQVISHAGMPLHIRQAGNIDDAEKFICAKPESLVIVNPAIIQHNVKSFQSLKNNWDKAHWMALVYLHYDQQVLGLFDGIISISDSPGTIISTIKKVLSSKHSQNTYISEDILSEREVEVLQLLAVGLSNKEIADKLSISINTVITHRKNISQKTGIKTVSGLTIYAVVNKYITLESVKPMV
ncbi:MAG TPA: LuxR C-terminal-related transcriptional regulator [Bacteroidales bacterium]|nr:LuxR C-terminal-related transcriptional regulator [Bacteroidales bacterium]